MVRRAEIDVPRPVADEIRHRVSTTVEIEAPRDPEPPHQQRQVEHQGERAAEEAPLLGEHPGHPEPGIAGLGVAAVVLTARFRWLSHRPDRVAQFATR